MEETTRRGDLVMYCRTCRAYVRVRSVLGTQCPSCNGLPPTRRCIRCGHEWVPRDPTRMTKTCPGCRSPYWCYTRTRTPPEDRR